MKKVLIAGMLLNAIMTFSALPLHAAPPGENTASAPVTSGPCANYKKFPGSDFSKLVCLTDIVKKSGFEIIYNGRTYNPKTIALLISAYLRTNYKNEKAEDWIEKHAHRSPSKGRIIYLKDSQGEMFVLKDVLLRELKTLLA